MVEVEGERAFTGNFLQAHTPSVGMKVKSASARADREPRKMVMELLVADQPARATSHDPDSSKFWHWAEKV